VTRDDSAPLDPEVLQDPVDEADEKGPPASRTLALTESKALAPADPFRRYLAELRKYPLLTREEEQALARRYRATGDRDALFRLVTSNLMLVVRIALSFRRAARNILDLIQEGNLGLLQAIERFDPELGVRLPTYAAWWIRAYIVKFLLDNVRLVRVGTTNARRKLLYNLRKEQARLESLGFEVGPRMLAEHFGVTEEDVRDVQKALASRDVSLDAPVGEDDERRRGETFAAEQPTVEEQVARRELQEKVQATLGRFRESLGERERAILDLRILSEDPATLQELGDRFGTTREAVRQQEARLMTRLRAFVQEELGDLAGVRIGPD
jgi:RNA polymerase sigma-32 factor